jgi:hypothetical protein
MGRCHRCHKQDDYCYESNPTFYHRYRMLCRDCAYDRMVEDEKKTQLAQSLSHEDLLAAIEKGEILIYHLPPRLFGDYDTVLACLQQYEGEDFDDSVFDAEQFLCYEQRRNPELLKKLILTDCLQEMYQFAPPTILNDRAFALKVIKEGEYWDHSFMRFLSPALRGDKKLALEWVSCQEDLQYLAEELRHDPDVIRATSRGLFSRNYSSPVSGDEIMQLFKLKPGKHIGILLSRLKAEIIEGRVANDHDAALTYLRSIIDGASRNLSE